MWQGNEQSQIVIIQCLYKKLAKNYIHFTDLYEKSAADRPCWDYRSK